MSAIFYSAGMLLFTDELATIVLSVSLTVDRSYILGAWVVLSLLSSILDCFCTCNADFMSPFLFVVAAVPLSADDAVIVYTFVLTRTGSIRSAGFTLQNWNDANYGSTWMSSLTLL